MDQPRFGTHPMDFQARRDRLRKAFHKAGIEALLGHRFRQRDLPDGLHGRRQLPAGPPRRRDHHQRSALHHPIGGGMPRVGPAISAPPGRSIVQATVRILRQAGIGRLGIEADSMTVGLRDRIADKLPKLAIVPTSGVVEKLRQIKDKDEIALIRRAVWQAEKAFAVLRSTLRPEKTEKESGRRVGTSDAAVWGERGVLSHASWPSGRGPHCPMPRPRRNASARTTSSWSTGGPTKGST